MRSQGRRTKDKNNPCSRGPLLLIVLVIIAGFMAVNLAGLHAAKESFKGSRTTGDVQLGLPLSLSAPQLPVEELCCSYRDIFSTSCSCKDSQCPLKSIDRLCIMALQEQRASALRPFSRGWCLLEGGQPSKQTRYCSCLQWQQYGIPCLHAIAAARS